MVADLRGDTTSGFGMCVAARTGNEPVAPLQRELQPLPLENRFPGSLELVSSGDGHVVAIWVGTGTKGLICRTVCAARRRSCSRYGHISVQHSDLLANFLFTG